MVCRSARPDPRVGGPRLTPEIPGVLGSRHPGDPLSEPCFAGVVGGFDEGTAVVVSVPFSGVVLATSLEPSAQGRERSTGPACRDVASGSSAEEVGVHRLGVEPFVSVKLGNLPPDPSYGRYEARGPLPNPWQRLRGDGQVHGGTHEVE